MTVVFFGGFSIWSVILLVAALALFAAELVHPGFGLPGVLGILALVLDILISSRTLAQGLILTAIAAVLVLAVVLLGATLFNKGRLPKKLVLPDELNAEAGFSGTGGSELTGGEQGKAVTVLRPAGIAEFGGRRLDVVTSGEFLPAGTALRVLRTEGSKVVVAASDESETASV